MPFGEGQSAFTFLGQANQERLLGPEDKSTMIYRNVGTNFSYYTAKYSLNLQVLAWANVPFIFEHHTNRSIQIVDSMFSCITVGNKLTECVAATVLVPGLSATVLSCYRHGVVTAGPTSD
jgi:hypothetical protein